MGVAEPELGGPQYGPCRLLPSRVTQARKPLAAVSCEQSGVLESCSASSQVLQRQVRLYCMLEALESTQGWLCTFATLIFIPASPPLSQGVPALFAAGGKGEVTKIQISGCDDNDTVVSKMYMSWDVLAYAYRCCRYFAEGPAADELSLLLASHLQSLAQSCSPAVVCLQLQAFHLCRLAHFCYPLPAGRDHDDVLP